ncbi:MAG: IS4 family transposase [Bacteroidota bacterium]
MTNITLFAQIIGKLCRQSFNKLVQKHATDKHSKGINSWTHLVSMLFCQFAKANSLREISNGLRSATGNLNHLGVERAPCKSSLSYINEHRDWQLFKDFYFVLLEQFYAQASCRKVKFRIKSKILLLDATVISVCLSVFDWALYRRKKGALKLHTVLDYDGCLPVFVYMTDGKTHEIKVAKELIFPSGSVVVADRAYLDFAMLYHWYKNKVNFVVRKKSNIKYHHLKMMPTNKNRYEKIVIDEMIELDESGAYEKYPEPLRLIVIDDVESNQYIEILTNNFSWTANTISDLYKARWEIEIFFRDIKQLLKIKSFVGTSPNAVLIQIWTAMITILVLKFLKQIARYDWCLSNLMAFLRMNLFTKIDLQRWLDKPFEEIPEHPPDNAQLSLF